MTKPKYLDENELELFRALIEKRGITQERLGKILGGLTQEAISGRFIRKRFSRLEAREVLKILKEEDKDFNEINF